MAVRRRKGHSRATQSTVDGATGLKFTETPPFMSRPATETPYPPLVLIPADRFVYRCGQGDVARASLSMEAEAPFPADQLAMASRNQGQDYIVAAGWSKRCLPERSPLLSIPTPLVPLPSEPDWSMGVTVMTSEGAFSVRKSAGSSVPTEVTLEVPSGENIHIAVSLTSASIDGDGMACFAWEWPNGKEIIRVPAESLAACDPRTRLGGSANQRFRKLASFRKATALLPYAAAALVAASAADITLGLSNSSQSEQLQAGEPNALKAQKELERARLVSSLSGEGAFAHLSALNATRPDGMTWQSFSSDGSKILVRGSATDAADVDRFRSASIGSGWFNSATITRASIGAGGGSFELTAEPATGLGTKTP
jgi:hypothetical protein